MGYPSGTVLGVAMVLWGIERSLDEHLWLGEDGHLGSLLVQLAGIALVIGGTIILWQTRRRWKEWLSAHSAPDALDSAAAPGDVGVGLKRPDRARLVLRRSACRLMPLRLASGRAAR